MVYTEEELKAKTVKARLAQQQQQQRVVSQPEPAAFRNADKKTCNDVQDLKEIARELGAAAGGRKDELILSILTAQGAGGAEELDDGLGDAGDDLVGGAEPAGAAAPAAAAEGKHAAIVFSLQKQEVRRFLWMQGHAIRCT